MSLPVHSKGELAWVHLRDVTGLPLDMGGITLVLHGASEIVVLDGKGGTRTRTESDLTDLERAALRALMKEER